MAHAPAHPKNRLLAAAAPDDWAALRERMEFVPLPHAKVLIDVGQSQDLVYFPEVGIVSTVSLIGNGETEMATTGREGLVSVAVVLGATHAFSRHIVQVAGEALVIPREDLRRAQERLPSLNALLMIYTRVFLSQVLQSVACNGVHDVEERCARWLLMCHDRSEDDSFPLTQEFLAEMLGVSRAAVNIVARTLQRAGLIRYSRGSVTITDRSGLEDSACECYRLVRRQFEDHLPLSFAPLTHSP